MTEFKAPLNLRIKNFILGHMHLMLVITFIALAVLFSSCNKAKAAQMEQGYKDWLIDYIQKYNDDVSVPYGFIERIQGYCNSYDSFIVFKAQSSYGVMVYLFNSSNPFFCPTTSGEGSTPNWSVIMSGNNVASGRNFGFFSGRGLVYGKSTLSGTAGINGDWTGRICQTWGTNNEIRDTVVSPGSTTYTQGWSPYFTYTSAVQGSGYYTLFMVQGSTIYTNYDEAFLVANYSSNSNYFYKLEKNVEVVSYTEDSRLRFYKSSTTYGDTLNIDISQFISDFPIEIPHQSDARLVPREITLTFDVDGTSRTYVVDPSSGIWLNDSTLVQVPYQWLVDANIYSSSAVSVTITNAEFTLQASNDNSQTVSYDYKIACDYNLVGQSNIIVPGTVQNPTYNNTDVVSNTEITNITNYFNNASSTVANGTWQFITTLPNFPSWAVIFESSLDYTTQDSLNFYNRFYEHPYGLGQPHIDMDSWLENSVYRFNDIIIIDIYSGTWGNDAVIPPTFTFSGYLVFYTDRYYLRQDAFNQLSIIQILQKDADNAVSYYQTVKSVLDDFEDKSIDAFNELIGIGNITNGWFATVDIDLNNGFASIVNAIDSLEFSVPAFDDTDILDKLDDIITAIGNIGTSENEIDTPQECIDFYIDNIDKDINDIDFELRPAYYEGMTLYILYSFDVDDNYSDDVQRASMRGTKANNPITDSENILVKVIITLRDTFTSSDAHNVINSTLKDMNGRSNYYTQLFESDYDCQEWEGWSYD